MRWDRVNAASEIALMWEVQLIHCLVALRNLKAQVPLTPETVTLLVPLVLLQQFELLAEGRFFEHFRSDRPVIVPLRNTA